MSKADIPHEKGFMTVWNFGYKTNFFQKFQRSAEDRKKRNTKLHYSMSL